MMRSLATYALYGAHRDYNYNYTAVTHYSKRKPQTAKQEKGRERESPQITGGWLAQEDKRAARAELNPSTDTRLAPPINPPLPPPRFTHKHKQQSLLLPPHPSFHLFELSQAALELLALWWEQVVWGEIGTAAMAPAVAGGSSRGAGCKCGFQVCVCSGSAAVASAGSSLEVERAMAVTPVEGQAAPVDGESWVGVELGPDGVETDESGAAVDDRPVFKTEKIKGVLLHPYRYNTHCRPVPPHSIKFFPALLAS